MANLAEIALRRLDGAYFEGNLPGNSATFAERYRVRLLGYKLDAVAETLFESAAAASRLNFFLALEAQLPTSLVNRAKSAASSIRTGSEFGQAMAKQPGKLTELRSIGEHELEDLFGRLVTQPLPYSEQDLEDLKALADRYSVGDRQAAARENNAVLAGLIPDYDWSRAMTVTDALRIAAVWSGGDQTLEVAPRFKLKRSQRRALSLALESVLEHSSYAYFDIARHKELWKRLFTALHVGDYKVPRLQAAAGMLFDGQLGSVDALLEYLIREEDLDGLLIHLRSMPGVFARRLHELIRKMPGRRAEIISEFEAVAGRVSTRVLVQLRNYFAGPSKSDAPNLPFAGKSRSARNGFLENRKSGDSSDVIAAVDSALSTKLSGKKVYIREGGEKIGVMTSNRSTATGSRAMASGSRVKLGDDPDFITLFTHWKNLDGGGRVDLDLSALFLSEDLGHSEHLSFYSTTSPHARYSGDITDAPRGAEEYIAVDVAHAKSRGFRYMATVVNSYTGQKIGSIPECYAGVAIAQSLNFGDFDAAAVEARFDLTAEGREVIPLLVDLETMELIWVDLAFAGASSGATMSGSNSLGSVLKFIVNYQGLTVGELIEKSGAVLVDSEADAEISIDPRMSDQVAQILV